MRPLDPHWSFAQSATRIGIELLLLNPTLRLGTTIYLDVADAFSRDTRLSDAQRQGWRQLRGRIGERLQVEQRVEEPDGDCPN